MARWGMQAVDSDVEDMPGSQAPAWEPTRLEALLPRVQILLPPMQGTSIDQAELGGECVPKLELGNEGELGTRVKSKSPPTWS